MHAASPTRYFRQLTSRDSATFGASLLRVCRHADVYLERFTEGNSDALEV
jgi:hypothetical protein